MSSRRQPVPKPDTKGTDVSLRAFHLFFIALSIVLAAFVAAWSANQYQLEANPGYLAAGLASILTAGALTVYVTRFRRRTRDL